MNFNKTFSNRVEGSDYKTNSDALKQQGGGSFSPNRGIKNNTGKLFFRPFSTNKPPVLSNYNVQNIKIDAVKVN
jgi:hypothetical protein